MENPDLRARMAYLKQQENAKKEARAAPHDRERIARLLKRVGLDAYRCGLMHRQIAEQAKIADPYDKLFDEWVYGLTESEGRRLLRALRVRLGGDD